MQGLDELLIVQDVALRGEEEPQDAVLDLFQLVAVGVDAHNQLVPLLLQMRALQTHNFTEGEEFFF